MKFDNQTAQRAALLLLLAAAVSITAVPAEAQAIIGGGGGLGVFNGIWSWFKSNMVEGIIVLGVAAIGVTLIMLRFHMATVASVCAGIAVLANAVAIGSGAMSGSSLLSGVGTP